MVPEIASLQIEGATATAQVKARVWFGDRGNSPGTDLNITLHLAKERGHWLATSAEGWAPAEDAYRTAEPSTPFCRLWAFVL